ncbi:MAG: CehA/McbA family metallohydrolase [Planctomycetales bacterium]|nr:CehA/McbA family metallohydrolase [Planctomycetales bacterium]
MVLRKLFNHATVLTILLVLYGATCWATELPSVSGIDFQPVGVHVNRLREALDYLGEPLPAEAASLLDQATKEKNEEKALQLVQDALDPLCLVDIQINPESRVKVQAGPAPRHLVQNGWRVFLVKVRNEAGVTAPLKVESEQAAPVRDTEAYKIRDIWLDLDIFGDRPLAKDLNGIGLEYRIIQLYSRDEGKRSAVLSFDVGQGTQDLGFRSDLTLVFGCASANEVTVRVRDENQEPTTASFIIRDAQDRVYPARSKRIAPDFGFHPQIYRADGETVLLPRGKFTVSCRRGPEYLEQTQVLEVGDEPASVSFSLERWVDPAAFGWWSGDHHIHAAGCSHYSSPTEGVHAPDMMRHCLGEDLKIGCNLTWGPCFDYQKQFFTGKDDPVSVYPYLLHYDVEVSGFGSHNSGHLCLLRLKQQIPDGGDSNKHWPTLCLNTLRWAKRQGAVVGPAHTGWGLALEGKELPNYEIPPFDGIGANEYIVDVTHMVDGPGLTKVPAVDFLSAVDTPYTWEMNIWYHTLNCGFRTRMSGETDFPCIYGERVGLGRAYVKLDEQLNYNAWCEGVRQGRTYVSDGRSHLIDFQVGDVEVGVDGSELRLDAPTTVRATATVAALLNENVEPGIKELPYSKKPYWHLERARIEGSREVPVELIVNGISVANKSIVADGTSQEISFDVPLEKSSWVAMRIEASSHTNPVFVLVDGKPIRASKQSAEWCLAGVERCWGQKERFIAPAEMQDAIAAYEHARETYHQIISESE